MNDHSIIIAVAKLDRLTFGSKSESSFADPTKQITTPFWLDEHGNPIRKFKDYLESRDAIIPVIEKQSKDIQHHIIRLAIQYNPTKHDACYFIDILIITAKQLCIALLKATGKWEE